MIDIDALVSEKITEKLDTSFEVTPDGEYIATISDRGPVKDWFRTVSTKNGDQPQCNILFVINDPEVAKKLGRNQATSRLTLWLDTELDNSGKVRIATGKGKNVSLGQLRAALNQDSDTSWSFDKLLGAGPVRITTQTSEGKSGGKFSNVTRVAKL